MKALHDIWLLHILSTELGCSKWRFSRWNCVQHKRECKPESWNTSLRKQPGTQVGALSVCASGNTKFPQPKLDLQGFMCMSHHVLPHSLKTCYVFFLLALTIGLHCLQMLLIKLWVLVVLRACCLRNISFCSQRISILGFYFNALAC